MSIELMSLVAPSVSETVIQLGKLLLKEAPAIIKGIKGSKLQRPDKRLSLGVTKAQGKEVATLFVEKDDSWAMRKAKKIEESFGGSVAVRVTGMAYSTWPQGPVQQKDPYDIRPGLSISHFGGYAGTLGCIVLVRSRNSEKLSIVGASHVLAMNNTAARKDSILLPGYPDGERTLENQIGTLTNYTFLVHHDKVPLHGRSENTEDIAVVKLDDQEHCPSANLVPSPKDPDRKIKLRGYLPDHELYERMSKQVFRVFKVGRTTGLTEGILTGFTTKPYPIRLPDRKSYRYKHILTVENKGNIAFSQPGDSGSLVYTSDGKGIGLIIGGSDQVTYLSPLHSCLKAMKAQILI